MYTTTATFCATMVDEWVRGGIDRAFVAPGSRSTPLALALAARPEIAIEVALDERTAGFAALGYGMATGRPAVTVCTSGTAAAHFHAPVIEADLSGIPLLVCTADRPPDLWGVGAPQTVDQTKLFGSSVRFFAQPGVPDERTRSTWRSLASQLIVETLGMGGRPGPVHANFSFADPLVGEPAELPRGRPDGRPWHADTRPAAATPSPTVPRNIAARVWDEIRGRHGVIVAGRGQADPAAIVALGRRLGWPVLADHRSGCRTDGGAVAHYDVALRCPVVADQAPEVVLRFGESLSSKALSQWLSTHQPPVIVALDPAQRSDPERLAHLEVPAAGLAEALLDLAAAENAGQPPSHYGQWWAEVDEACARVISELADGPDGTIGRVTEPGVARAVLDRIADGSALVVSSSMPVRDVEWYGGNRDGVTVYANRGANGIDGVIATAIGVAATGVPTTVLIGDVAFCHDSTSLIGLARRSIDLTIVVIDNNGGGIFSFLPQADQLPEPTFELLFGTPHQTDLAALARANSIPVSDWADASLAPDGVKVVLARTERETNRALHDEINQACAKAIAVIGGPGSG